MAYQASVTKSGPRGSVQVEFTESLLVDVIEKSNRILDNVKTGRWPEGPAPESDLEDPT